MDYDIIIVGAGPAGLSTGLHLAQLAPHLLERTLILEREQHPRPKLCAGGVLPAAEACLRRLGLDLGDIPSVPVREMRLRYEDRAAAIRRRPVCFRAVRREVFDAWLADAARQRGLRLGENTRVRELALREGLVELVTDQGRFRARAVVGADGSKSLVRRLVARRPLHQTARLLEVRQPAGPENPRKGVALFDFSGIEDRLQGYVWDFPTPGVGEAMRTWGVYDSRIYPGLPRASLPEALEEGMLRHGGQLGAPLEGHPLRWFSARAAFSAPHILLVGDAAGTDPVVGEGISFALSYGEIAAGALQDAFARGDFSFADYRRRVLRHRAGRYLRRRVLGARLLYGVRNRFLLRALWPLIVWAAGTFFIDWTGGRE